MNAVKNNPAAIKIMVYNPISLGLLKKPGEIGCDIAVAEGQPLGLSMSAGGPLLGMISAKKEFSRFMPGRIVGRTVDVNGKSGFVLTMQAREQHIRRENTLSNICSNESLCALRAAVYLSMLGNNGLSYLADMIYKNTQFFINECKKKGFKFRFTGKVFNEFILQFNDTFELNGFIGKCRKNGILPGISIENLGLSGCMLTAVTEKIGLSEINDFIDMRLK